MQTVLKEYGLFMVAIVGAMTIFVILTLLINSWRQTSKWIVASIAGVQPEEIESVMEE